MSEEIKKFKAILNAEHNLIKGTPFNTTGLALSGGGIRSATFNLGIIQGLAKQNVLHRFDYLSTVSGGGYIGAWLSALIHRKGNGNIKKNDNNARDVEYLIAKSIDETELDAYPIKHLRNHSNYLTPQKGFFSTDTLSAIATYTRNLILNQSVIILSLAVLLMIPRLIHDWGKNNITLLFYLTVASLIIAIFFIAKNILYESQKQPNKNNNKDTLSTHGVIFLIGLPLVIACTSISQIILILKENNQKYLPDIPFLEDTSIKIIILVGLLYLMTWGLASILAVYNYMIQDGSTKSNANQHKRKYFAQEILIHFLATFFAGCIGGALFLKLSNFITSHYKENVTEWAMLVFGPPIVMIIFSLTVVYHIGLAGRYFSDKQHEWWSRLSAPLIAIMSTWTVLFGISVFGPTIIERIRDTYAIPTLTSGWLINTAFSVVSAKNSNSKEENTTKYLDIFTTAGPYVFILGLLLIISYSIQWMIMDNLTYDACINGKSILECQLEEMTKFDKKAFEWIAIAFSIALILAWRVNINLFSLHHFYRNRLVRAYLGATNNERHPHPFTGFDEADDFPIKDLKQRPYHIINTALNFTNGKKLGYQDRKSSSFIFSPLYCGFSEIDDQNKSIYHYVNSSEYGTNTHGDHKDGFLLGSAVAISGAAANTMMGYHSSPALAFLLAVFNVRLGRWCANTKITTNHFYDPKQSDPWFGYYYLLSELFGYANTNQDFVQLSDGGHFENTGLYELVRRGCKHIVVCDAGADPDYSFEDLANAIRKCRTDFGVEIDINVDDLRLYDKEKRLSKLHYALGEINYGNYLLQLGGLKDATGTLIVLKPSLTESEEFPLSTDVRHYAATNQDFPQQTTADQWFDDAQFESYRKLGNHVVEALFKGLSAEKMSEHGFPSS